MRSIGRCCRSVGDLIGEGSAQQQSVVGETPNLAARLEALADAGGVFVSNTVYDHVRDRLPFVFDDHGLARRVGGLAATNTPAHRPQLDCACPTATWHGAAPTNE
jgi:class 3 adenylate cyclase